MDGYSIYVKGYLEPWIRKQRVEGKLTEDLSNDKIVSDDCGKMF